MPSPEAEFEDFTTDTAYFNLQRLGVRIPTLAISPWIPKGTVISAAPSAQKPTNTSEYDLTSIMATVRKLFPSMTQDALSARDAWSSTFEHVFDTLTESRGDCPLHLPDANVPTPATNADALRAIGGRIHAPLIDIQEDIARVHAHLAGVRMPEFVNQVVHAQWLSSQYRQHHSLAKVYDAHIKGQSMSYEVQMLWKNNPAGSGEAEDQWDVNGIPHGNCRNTCLYCI